MISNSSFLIRNAYLSSQGAVHGLTDGFGLEALPHQIHQLRERSLYGRVVSADDACFEQLKACLVEVHLNASCRALCDVDDDFTRFGGLGQCFGKPFGAWRISTTEGAEDDALTGIPHAGRKTRERVLNF